MCDTMSDDWWLLRSGAHKFNRINGILNDEQRACRGSSHEILEFPLAEVARWEPFFNHVLLKPVTTSLASLQSNMQGIICLLK